MTTYRGAVAVMAVCCAALVCPALAGGRVMPWLCLERCDDNITNDLAQLSEHYQALSAVSFESYDVAADGGLLDDHFTVVDPAVRQLALQPYPMVTTVDIYKLQLLFNNPTPFIDAAIKAGLANGYAGYNLDFEPCQYVSNCTDADAAAYAGFLDTFAAALHKHGMELTIDVATWTPFWNYTRLAATRVDRIILMTTYTSDTVDFVAALKYGVEAFGVNRVGVGLCDTCSKSPLSESDMAARFEAIDQANIQEIDLWDWPVPAMWWSFINKFAGV